VARSTSVSVKSSGKHRAIVAGPVQAADSHDFIRVHGARENNLRDVSVEIPKRRLTVFTGISGSGKSSLVFNTIAAESQRLINETYRAFVHGFMPTLARPEPTSSRSPRRCVIMPNSSPTTPSPRRG
jgi:ABC-type glutathione transport system ATPase component